MTAYHEREASILNFWESAVGLTRWNRDDALLATDGPPPTGLGARNVGLLAIREALFDRRWPLKSRCPACAADCEFEIDSAALARELAGLAPANGCAVIELAGISVTLRAPNIEDLRAISRYPDHRTALVSLLSRCLSGDLDLAGLDDAQIDALGESLELLDPAAIVSFELSCPACSQHWQAMIDIGDALWTELQHAAERSVVEVDALARAYGWTEDQIMSLSPTRRAAYLQLTGAS